MKRKIKIIVILFITIATMILCAYRINATIDSHVNTTLKNTVYKQVNDAIHRYITINTNNFANAVKHEYDSNGELVCVSLNSALINNIKTGLEKELLSTIYSLKETPFYLHVGNFTGIRLLSQKGPKIKMLIAPLGNLTFNTINTFDSVGINHTLHKVGFEFKIEFSAAAPFHTTTFETKFTVLICETIIIGKVPSVYVN